MLFPLIVKLSVVWQLIRHGDPISEHNTIKLRSRKQLAVVSPSEKHKVCLASDHHAAVVLTQTHYLRRTCRHREWPTMDRPV